MTGRAPISIEETVMLALPGDAQISPDGRYVAYSLVDTAKDGSIRHGHLWLATTDGSAPPREITGGPRLDSAPRWSPDSTRIAFISDRVKEGEQGIYLLPVAGGEAKRLGNVGDGGGALASLAWATDGASLVVARTEPDTDALKARKEAKDDSYLYDEHRKYTYLWRVDATSGAAVKIGPDSLNVWASVGYDWSPDNAHIAFVGSAKPGFAHSFGATQLYVLTLANGNVREIEGTYGAPGRPAWSPDGTTLAFLARPNRTAQGATQLMLVDIATGQIETRLAEREVGKLDAEWLPDGRTLLLTLLDSTAANLHRYTVATDELSAPLAHFSNTGAVPAIAPETFSLDHDATHIALVRGDLTHPVEVWAGPLDGPLTQLSHHTDDLAARRMSTARVVRWQAGDGHEIAGILITPDAATHGPGPYPFLVHVHGGPAGVYAENYAPSWSGWGWLLAEHGYAALLPNPRGSSGRGDPFQTLNLEDWGGADMRDILAGVDYCIAEGVADAERTAIGGWSYGGFMTAWTESQTTRFKAAVVGAGLCNLVSFNGTTDITDWHDKYFGGPVWEQHDLMWDHSAMKYVTQVTTPTLVLHGEVDERVPFSQGQEWAKALGRRDIPVSFVAYPREAHPIEERAHQRDLLTRVLAWYDQYVKGNKI